jgi:LPS-assembly protein
LSFLFSPVCYKIFLLFTARLKTVKDCYRVELSFWWWFLGQQKQTKYACSRLWGTVSCGALLLGLALVSTAAPAHAIVNKPLIEPITTLPPDGTQVNVDADKITYDPNSENAVATGTVQLVYGPFTLTATRVEYNSKTGAFKANGSVVIREPNGNILKADSLALADKFKTGFANHVKALLTNNAVITAVYAKRYEGEITVYEHATYTACSDCKTRYGKPLWQVVADEATHDNKTHDITYINPKLEIGGVTVAASPYLVYPDPTVKRRSGFLIPELKFNKAIGVGISPVYFWALAPDYDLTFRPVISSRQGLVGDVEFRQATATGRYNLRAIGVHQFTKLAPPDDQEWRGAIYTAGDFALNQDWRWGWNGTFVSDVNFLNAYGYDGREIAYNDVHATGLWDQTYVSTQVMNFQSLSTAVNPSDMPYAMPYVSGEKIIRDFAFDGDVSMNWSAYSLHRDRSSSPYATVDHGTDQTRGVFDLGWKTQYISDAGVVVSPFAKMRSEIYVTENVPGATTLSETTGQILPSLGVDARMPFIASTGSGQSVISPVFQIISAANQSNVNEWGNEDAITLNFDHTSLFLSDRFTGYDRYEGGTRANVGVTYAYYGSEGGFVRASVGESLHIAGQNSFLAGSGLSGANSDIVANVVFQPWSNFSLSYEARILNDFSALERQEASASLTVDKFSANLAYLNIGAEPNYGRIHAEHWAQGDVKLSLDDGWSVFGGLAYDIGYSQLTRKTLGLEFDCECMNFRVTYQGTKDPVYLTTEDRVMLSLELATLGKAAVSSTF